MTFNKKRGERLMVVRRENDVKFTIPPIDAALKKKLALAWISFFYLMQGSVINVHQ